MNIESINSANPFFSTNEIGETEKPFSNSFGSSITDAVKSLDQTQRSAEQEISRAVTGDSPDLHKTIIALQTADLKFQFGLQVRNKLVGAYEEVMRMQV